MKNSTTPVNNVVTEFEAQVAKMREERLQAITATRLTSEVAINDALRRESARTMVDLLHKVAEAIDYDEEVLDRKIMVTRRSEYGRIPALINILANLYVWPITANGNPAEVEGLREDILECLTENGIIVDKDLLLDIKESKGFHTFIDDEGNIIDGVEPDYEEYNFYILTFAENAKLSLVDNKLTELRWQKEEKKAINKAKEEQQLMQEALKRHEELIADEQATANEIEQALKSA